MSLKHPVGLRQWIWRAFVQSALIPLVLVETVLIAIYLLSNNAIRDAQIEHLRQTALTDLEATASLEASIVDEQLKHVSALTNLYRNLTTRTLLDEGAVQPLALALSSDGVRFNREDQGGSAYFYSNATPVEQQDLRKAAKLASLDPLMKELQTSSPLVASLYFNSWDSLNHIYPWFLTPDQYPHDMVIPDYNFYYLADATHNPERKVVWTDVYLDPAGHGWMMSAIAPVYRGDFLEGVVGVDITVGGILEQIGQLQVPWDGYAMLVSDDLNIMAMPAPAEEDFGLDELTEHSYEEAIRREIFKPEDFSLLNNAQTTQLAGAIKAQPSGVQSVALGGRTHLVAWAIVEQTGWRLLTVVDEADVFSQTNALANRYQQIGYLLIAGLVVFYLLFFAFMWARARQLSQHLLNPIAGISRMMDQIGSGNWLPQQVKSEIRELDQLAGHATSVGTQLEQSEAERTRIQQRLELVLESATESIWERSYETDIIQLRGRFCARFGLSSEALSETDFLQRIHPQDVATVKESLRLAHVGELDRFDAEYRFADAAGEYHWLLSRGRVLERDARTGKARILAGTHVDIDALKQIEDELRAAILDAHVSCEAKSRFISSMSHELRTPLNAIQGFAQLMRMEQGDQAEGETDHLEEILLASRHLNQLVDDILDWSSIQANATRVDLQPVDVSALMSETAGMVRGKVARHGLQFNLDLPEEFLQASADPRRLRQVLINLLSNAVKYNRPGGQVTLSYQVAAGHIRLVVEDTGLGIDEDLQAQLFEPFKRLGRENTAIQGTGLGLSLCREFATLMHGSIGLHSELGIGSSFWIELPLIRRGGVSPLSEQSSKSAQRSRIFYVEDNPASQFLVRKALADLGEVSVASNGRVALEQMLADPPDLLLLDLNLPGLNGDEVLRQLRLDPRTKGLQVIVLSAAAVNEVMRMASLDCQGLLSKPVDVDELRGLVQAMLYGVNADAD